MKFELALSNLCRRPLTLEFTFYFSLDFSFLLQTIKKVRDFLSLPFYYYYHFFFFSTTESPYEFITKVLSLCPPTIERLQGGTLPLNI